MRKFLTRCIYLIVFLSIGSIGYAQKSEIGVLGGGSYYYGDIVNNFQPQTIRPSFGVFLRYHLNKRVSLRGNFMYCRVGGADSNLTRTPQYQWQKDRNLAFYSDIFELSGMVEYNLVEDQNKGRRIKNRLIPYVLGA